MSSRELLLVKNFSACGELTVKSSPIPRGQTGLHQDWLRRCGDLCDGGTSSVSGEEGIVAVGGISRGTVSFCGWSMEGLSVRDSGAKTSLADVARLGASEMIPQP